MTSLRNCANGFTDYGFTNSHCFVFMLAKEERGYCSGELLIVQSIWCIIFFFENSRVRTDFSRSILADSQAYVSLTKE